ncbi:hypothetical protein Q9233_002937 [Columba guinea]|nr:hypothetical protein Q9233_002937 [Columba guinea]
MDRVLCVQSLIQNYPGEQHSSPPVLPCSHAKSLGMESGNPRHPDEPIFIFEGHANFTLAKSALQYDPPMKLNAVIHEYTEIT